MKPGSNALRKTPNAPLAPAELCRPFVKWVGGKSQLLPELEARMPVRYRRYFEPFAGGGALFFSVRPADAVLIDSNPELINAYCVIRDEVAALIRSLDRHTYDEDYFYDLRERDRSPQFKRWSAVRRASRLIYLNKTCYNGLYRVNSLGHFNTPFGRYTNPTILDEENLRACSRALRRVEILEDSFLRVEDLARRGDFAYFDPPYAPLSATANFTGYEKEGFSLEMQTELRDLCVRLDRRGVKFMLSNSDVRLIRRLYRGFKVTTIYASRAINSDGRKRGKIPELLITNY